MQKELCFNSIKRSSHENAIITWGMKNEQKVNNGDEKHVKIRHIYAYQYVWMCCVCIHI